MSRLNRILDINQNPVNLAFISSYVPRKCGIATYTRDLTTAINALSPQSLVNVVAMNNEENHRYPKEVVHQIERNNLTSYEDAARFINHSSAQIVCLQHEYGLFGGESGEYIFKLLSRLRQPLVTTLHTILENPSPLQRDVLFRIAKLSEAVVAMIPDAKDRLEKDYDINPDKVVVIHHGVTDQPKATRENKIPLGWGERPVLLMTGLLNPNKGAEYVVEALPAIKEKFPNILFAIVGQTHPEIIRQHGEVYREGLVSRAKELGVEENLQLINEYVELKELLTYYEACDIYLTPHLDPQQITSGTLAYALGMGKACVSTPYVYAREMLANGNGKFIKYHDPSSIAAVCTEILSDPELQSDLETRAYTMGRHMSWPLVAERYLMLFRIVEENYGIGAKLS